MYGLPSVLFVSKAVFFYHKSPVVAHQEALSLREERFEQNSDLNHCTQEPINLKFSVNFYNAFGYHFSLSLAPQTVKHLLLNPERSSLLQSFKLVESTAVFCSCTGLVTVLLED